MAWVNYHYSSSYCQVLFELNDNNTLLRAPLLKNCKICHEIEVGNIVRLLLLSQARNMESDGIFSAFLLKNIPQVNYGKQPAAQSNAGACSQKYSG